MNDTLKKHLELFEELDFQVFNKQDWENLHKSHSKDVKVIWPDGHETTGIDVHSKDMADMFVAIPDYRVTSHPVTFGSEDGEWTCAVGMVAGTFSKPMPIGDGKFIQPTNKELNLNMCTVAHWKDGLIDIEYLFWDSGTYMKQLGLTG